MSADINDYCFPSYDASEIKEAFDCFDINKNGYIGVNELKEIFSIIGEDVTNEELDEMIGIADKEGDGQVNWLNFYEFLTGNAMNKEIKQLVLEMNEVSQQEEGNEGGKDKANRDDKSKSLAGSNNGNGTVAKPHVQLTVNIPECVHDEVLGVRDKHEKEVFDNIMHSIGHTAHRHSGTDTKKEHECDASKDLLLDNTSNGGNMRKLTSHDVNERFAKEEPQNNILLLLKKKNLLNNN